jgi:MFS family permease
MLSIFYTRKEIATRIALLYCAQILATGFSGLIAAGVFQMDGIRGLAGWRWLFILLVHPLPHIPPDTNTCAVRVL